MRGPSQMDELMAIAREHKLPVLEDVAQADGGGYHGQRLGSVGDVGAFSLQFNKILTCGEGGMVTTSDDDILRRVLMYNDVVGGQRNNVPDAEILPGINFRMSELQGAVALVQLGRLDELLGDMRRRHAEIKDGIAGVARQKGVEFRRSNDPDGDTGIALIFFAPTPERAPSSPRRSRPKGWTPLCSTAPRSLTTTSMPTGRRFSVNGPGRRTGVHGVGTRGRSSTQPDMCPRTLDLLGRAVHLDVSPDLSDQNVAEIVEAVNKVLSAAL